MPIYAYRCSACGHAQDVLQKISAPVLTVCPACGQATYAKQVTAAGFQLKGSGWYVTDFRDGNKGAPAKEKAEQAGDATESAGGDKPAAKPAEKAADKPAGKAADKADAPAGAGKPAAAAAAKPAADKPAAKPPASPPAGG